MAASRPICGGGDPAALAMSSCAKAKARPKNKGGRRVTDSSLKLKRTPHAFAFFLADMKRKALSWKKRRLTCKTTVSRRDLYLMRYRHLTRAEKQVYVDKAEEAKQKKDALRRQLLQARRAAKKRPAAPSAVVEEAKDHSAGAQMWLSLPMPRTSAHESCLQEGGEDMLEPATPSMQWPLAWHWTEEPSAVQHEVEAADVSLGCGSYGCCVAVRDKVTGEAFCLKFPEAVDRAARESVKHEFRILSRLRHPNVVSAIAWVTSSDGVWQGFFDGSREVESVGMAKHTWRTHPWSWGGPPGADRSGNQLYAPRIHCSLGSET